MRRIRWYLPLVVGLLGLMIWNVNKLLHAETPTVPRPADVANARRTVAPPPGQLDERDPAAPAATVAGNGVVEPAAPETQVGAGVAGRIARIVAREGQVVAAGATLVELEAGVETAAVAAAESELAAAQAQLRRAVRGSRSEDVKVAAAEAEAAAARAELSRGVAERLTRAGVGGAATGDEIDRARRQAEVDAGAARAASARQAAAVAGSRREDVELARAQVAAAEARRDQARAVRERLRVVAPLAGEVLQLKYRAGEYYQPGGEPLAVVGDTSHLRVRLDIDERDLGRIARGAAVTVRANAFPGVDFAGKVVEIGRRMGRKNVRTDDPAERNDTKILEVVVELERPDGLIVGQRVTGFVTSGGPQVTASRSSSP